MRVGSLSTNRIASINYIKTDNFNKLKFGSGQLKSIDLSIFNLSNLTSVNGMFTYCSRLEEIKGIDSLDTSNITNMYSMFCSCSKLTSLDLSSFNTSNVTDMSMMFYNCKSLTSLDLSNFNTDSLEDVGQLFSGCESLTSLNLSTWNTSNVKSIYTSGMFKGIPSDIDWCYDPEDPNSYANFTLTEEQTGFSGTFPWNQ